MSSAIQELHIGLLQVENRKLLRRLLELEEENKQLRITVENATVDFNDTLSSTLSKYIAKFEQMDADAEQNLMKLNDALERLDELEKSYGKNPSRR